MSEFFSSTVATGMPFRLNVISSDFSERGEKWSWRVRPETIRGVARFKFRIQLVRRLEVRGMKGPPVALESVSQRR